jgi:hypothetical protein
MTAKEQARKAIELTKSDELRQVPEAMMAEELNMFKADPDLAWRDEMIRELREALKFYADERNYHSRGGVEDVQNSVVDSDNGTIARDALGEKKR